MKGAVIQPFGNEIEQYLDSLITIPDPVVMPMQQMAYWFSRVGSLGAIFALDYGGTAVAGTVTLPKGYLDVDAGISNLAVNERDCFQPIVTPYQKYYWVYNNNEALPYDPFGPTDYASFSFQWYFAGLEGNPANPSAATWRAGFFFTIGNTPGNSVSSAPVYANSGSISNMLIVTGDDLPLGETYTHLLPMYYDADSIVAIPTGTIQIGAAGFFPWTSREGNPTYDIVTGARLIP